MVLALYARPVSAVLRAQVVRVRAGCSFVCLCDAEEGWVKMG